MSLLIREQTATPALPGVINGSQMKAQPLTDEHLSEVLAFLAERPVHTFGMAGFIHTNGIVSEHNRGKFYAARNEQGDLKGVALIGNATIFETQSDAAIAAFARAAQGVPGIHFLLGEQEKVQTFWNHYSTRGKKARLYCRELLYRQCWPAEVKEEVPGLRLASLDDLDLIVPVHALTALEESGEDPLLIDPVGFRKRCAHRIEKRQTWVWIENGRLIFKAEVLTDTPEVIYLEGVWVDPAERGKGYGTRCMSQLARSFLERTASICVLVNDKHKEAQSFYRSMGYELISYYDTIFLQ